MSNDSTRREEFTSFFQKRFGGDRQRFMDETNMSKGRVTQLLDPDEPFGERAAINLEDRLSLSRGEVFPSLVKHQPASAKKDSPNGGGVPVVGTAQLGDDGFFYELEYPVGHGDGRVMWQSKDENAYSVRCRGESMKPRIRHGEYVIIEPNHEYVPGDEVLVRSHAGKVMIKQFAFTRDGMVHLDSVNESFARISIAQEEVAAIHYVAGIAKSALWKPS